MTTLQKKVFQILQIFTQICDQLQLKYFLVCGSALGAVKYGGFVPWDDDADVAHRIPEALAGRLDDGHRVKAGAYAHQQAADEQREERVQFEFDDQRQDDRDGHKKGQDEREVTVHEGLL